MVRVACEVIGRAGSTARISEPFSTSGCTLEPVRPSKLNRRTFNPH